MLQDKKLKSTPLAILLWVLSLICMAVIFYFSAQNADDSSQQSDYILVILQKLFGDNYFTNNIIRKSAHYCEYLLLCFLLNGALLFSTGKQRLLTAIGIASAYSVTDEIHQLFSDGRSCQFKDWVIDTAGAITGALIFLAICYVIMAIVSKAKSKQPRGDNK